MNKKKTLRDKELAERLDEAREWASSVGYQESDVDEIIKDVRRKRKQHLTALP